MIRFLAPLALFIALAVLLGVGLKLNPRLVPSPLVGKPAPQFSLPRLHRPETAMTRDDMQGRVALLNAWATWCVGCREEHPVLVEIARTTDIPIYGLNYKDQRPDAITWLRRLGNPYVMSAFDQDGRVGIDLGVYGLPETFVVGRDGIIAYKHIGPISPDDWRDKILPIVERLRGDRG